MFVQIEIGTHCNFTCFYCAGRDMRQEYMSLDMFQSILDQIPDGQHVVCLQGEGEPTIHPNFWELVASVRARNHFPYTITNGSRLDICKVAANFPRIGVSIDTLDPYEAERIGRKKLAKVLANVELLVHEMGPERITIMTVDYGQNMDSLNAYIAKLGIRDHIVQPLQIKDDYAYRYQIPHQPKAHYTYQCRYLNNPLHLTFGLDGRSYPCCYIKDTKGYESADQLRATLARHNVPECCSGCREIQANVAQPVRMGQMGAKMPRISLILPVKGHLDKLKETLPRLVGQIGVEVIVVDYDCPDGTALWVTKAFPQVRVVKVAQEPAFNLARARNLGANIARGEWLGFINADLLVAENFVASITPILLPGNILLPPPISAPGGVIVCRSADFREIRGYDELFEGWSCEDDDLRIRLLMLGRRPVQIPNDLLSLIHDDGQQWQAHHDYRDKWLDLRINRLYLQIKLDLARQLGLLALSVDELKAIYAEVRKTVFAEPTGTAQITITLPQITEFTQLPGWELCRTLSYRFSPTQPLGQGSPSAAFAS